MKWLGKILEHPIVAGLIVAGMGSLGSVWAYFLGWWPSIFDALGRAWDFIFQTVQVPLWALGVLAILFGLLVIVAVAAFVQWLRSSEPAITFTDYTNDHFFNIHWFWRYGSSGGGIFGLSPFCPNCQMPIRPERTNHYLEEPKIRFACDGPDCGGRHLHTFKKEPNLIEDDVTRRIQQKLNTGDWLKVVQSQRGITS